MNLFKRPLSILLIAVFMFSFVNFNAVAEEVDYWETDRLVHSAEYYFAPIEETVYYESDEYAKYAYIVKNGEASIVNIHVTYQGDEKIDLVLPTKLGGYPVTAIGYEYNNTGIDATWYIHYGEDPFEKYPEYLEDMYYPERDPGMSNISRLVIPEGYKYIYDCALKGKSYVSFPKSLKAIYGAPFEELYTNASGEFNYYKSELVLPECVISSSYNSIHAIHRGGYNKFITMPSRDTNNTANLLYSLRECTASNPSVYIPSNLTYKSILSCFYYFEAAAGDAGEIRPISGTNMTLHCAPDSEFLQVFEDYTKPKNLTIITDVTPAEYIAFPSEMVNIHVGDVVDLEAKTYPTDAIWTACDYTVSDPSIVKIDEYSGRITALKEGTVTVTATHCERDYVDTCTVNVTTKPEPGVNGIEPATDTPYVTYGNRDYKVNVTGSPSKIQVVRDNGGTTTIDRRKATVTSNGDTETWIVNMRVEAGTHNIRAKYGNVWDKKLTPFTVEYDLPGAYSFDLTYENGIGNFNVVTDPEVIKIQFALDNGCTLTYSQTNSYIGEDGLRHWEISRKIPTDRIYTLRTKYGYTWTDTNFEVNTIV